MKITLMQTKFKTGAFQYNYENIAKNIEKTSTDLIIFPQSGLEDMGGKDLLLNEKCNIAQSDIYKKIAENFIDKTVLVGDVLIQNGEISLSLDGFYEIMGKKVFVSDYFSKEVECDLYVLAKNRYYTMNSYKDFVENIEPKSDFIYVNAIGMADENIYAGGSFAKNKNNELVLQMPLCKEDTEAVDFSRVLTFKDEPVEKQVLEVTTFALKEYCENTGFKKVILGLSGGIDSALTAALAVKAIGSENVLGILMPSMFSSQGSVADSLELADNLHIETITEPITPMFDAFMEGRDRKYDLAEENLQARLRALILMFYSNRENRLLLSTGNKSESSMGYGTLYGDLAGGYNMICDLTKTNVYKLSNYINKDREIIPQNIIDKAPSAELRPNQKDLDSLPEYAILDDIIEMFIEQNIAIDEIIKKYDEKLVKDTIGKIYRSQFKRKQCCLGVRLTERSYLCGVCFPIVNSITI